MVWSFEGIFDSKEAAVKECKTANYFIAPVKLNEVHSDERKEFPNCEYPVMRKDGNT